MVTRSATASVRRLALCLLPAFVLTTGNVLAEDNAGASPQDQMAQALTRAGSGWIFGGGLAVADPGYVGLSRQLTPIPLIFYHNGRFFFAGFSAGYALSHARHYRLSIDIKPRINRLKASDSPELAGIQTRKWSLDGGANLDLFGEWGHLVTGISHDLLDRNNGTELDLGYHYVIRLGGWDLTPNLGLRWESASLTNYYYGVSQAEVIPGRPAYAPGAASNPYIGLGLSTRISSHWTFHGSIQYTHFASAIHNSPIIDRSGNSILFVGFVYNSAGI